VIGAEHGTEVLHALTTAPDTLLVEVITKQVGAVRAGEVVKAVAIEVGYGGSRGRGQQGAGLEVLAHETAELKRHAIAGRELQVRDGVGEFGAARGRDRETLGEGGGQPHEALATSGRDFRWRVVGPEEVLLVVFPERHKPGQAARHARVPGERAMLCHRELQSQLQLAQDEDENECGQQVPDHCVVHEIP
jgi:hypothetical protein